MSQRSKLVLKHTNFARGDGLPTITFDLSALGLQVEANVFVLIEEE